LERAIRDSRDDLTLSIDDIERERLFQVVREQSVRGEDSYQMLLRTQIVYEYRDAQGRWFGINPSLEETDWFQAWQQQNR
jgi:hypothetical protein